MLDLSKLPGPKRYGALIPTGRKACRCSTIWSVLALQFPAAELKRVLPPGCDVLVDIALFFDTVNVSATIPHRGIEIIGGYNARLEIICYPSTIESDK